MPSRAEKPGARDKKTGSFAGPVFLHSTSADKGLALNHYRRGGSLGRFDGFFHAITN